jgi:hypothetical protein
MMGRYEAYQQMNPPFNFLSSKWRARSFWMLLPFALLLMVIFSITGEPLITEASPLGLISFEVAGSVQEAENILAHWNPEAQKWAAFGLGLDFLYIPVYWTVLALGCTMSAAALKRGNWPLSSIGVFLSWTQGIAALLDIVENIALLTILFGMVVSPWPQVARWCALVKFAIIFLGVVYIFYSGVIFLVSSLITTEGSNPG